MDTLNLIAMNTQVNMAAEGSNALALMSQAQEFIQESERRFTRFSGDSELSALNRSAGRWFDASPEMVEVLSAALECHAATSGLFNPAILLNLQAAGYNRSMDKIRESGSLPGDLMHDCKPAPPFSKVVVDGPRQRIFLPLGMQIDLGGIAKGWIAERAARQIAREAPACVVNAGGDMFFSGRPSGQDCWEVFLEDPLDPAQNLMIMLVDGGAVATSTVTKRTWQQGNLQRHHLIDPRTGQPAQSPWLSVTTFSPSAARAETFAKAILIAGPGEAGTLLENNPDISFIAVDEERQLWTTPAYKEKIVTAQP